MTDTLVIEYSGWLIIRLATDPDPTDEPRGLSGYTYAFAGEPDLDRLIRFQLHGFTPRSHGPDIGVTVKQAKRLSPEGKETDVPGLVGATVDLLDNPRLEMRNWVLTYPGNEPIVPFHFSISTGDLEIRRQAPLVKDDPDLPVWKTPLADLMAHGAAGVSLEPDTIGRATGVWDWMPRVKKRLAQLKQDRAALESSGGDPAEISCLSSRIYELQDAVDHPQGNNRMVARLGLERFSFKLDGESQITGDQERLLGGKLDSTKDWPINFWFGSWDHDILCAHTQGSLQLAYA